MTSTEAAAHVAREAFEKAYPDSIYRQKSTDPPGTPYPFTVPLGALRAVLGAEPSPADVEAYTVAWDTAVEDWRLDNLDV